MKKNIFLVLLFVLFSGLSLRSQTLRSSSGERIDRESLVKRHSIVTTGTNLKSPTQVGNGRFAFGMDITGLQTFVPFNTLSDWSWHSFPVPVDTKISDYKPVVVESYGKKIPYMDYNQTAEKASYYMVRNPHRFNLGRIGFRILKTDGTEAGEVDLKHLIQEVDIWTGIVHSRFEINGKPVDVETVCHPDKDMIGVSVKSELLTNGLVSVFLDFPYPDNRYFRDYVGRYDTVQAHKSLLEDVTAQSACIARTIDTTRYFVSMHWTTPAAFARVSCDSHRFILKSNQSDSLSFTCRFSPEKEAVETETEKEVATASATSWKKYWMSGAAVDLSGSKDYRWWELERRIVLSQYLMRMNECGLFPPQESGLVNNGWYGRFHFEMIWWHGLHYYLWDRPELFNSYLGIYKKYLSDAVLRAKSEGRSGARWPKCTGNINREWPCGTHAFLLWHEPHPIYFAETEYRLNPTKETLDKWKEIVMQTADYMADNVFYDKQRKQYVLGPPLVLVSENTNPYETINPTFELSYWRYGLRTAATWCKRLGLPVNKKWTKVLSKLAPLPVKDSVYVTYEGIPDMWTKYTFEHPALTGVLGMLPGDGVDKATFKRTLAKVCKEWQFKKIWGWDFPMMAMAAAKTGQPKLAVDMLMYPTFNFMFDEHGYASGGPHPYFPSNGGLLTAVAMMCAGWDGSVGEAPGFPTDGTWKVRYENLAPIQ